MRFLGLIFSGDISRLGGWFLILVLEHKVLLFFFWVQVTSFRFSQSRFSGVGAITGDLDGILRVHKGVIVFLGLGCLSLHEGRSHRDPADLASILGCYFLK